MSLPHDPLACGIYPETTCDECNREIGWTQLTALDAAAYLECSVTELRGFYEHNGHLLPEQFHAGDLDRKRQNIQRFVVAHRKWQKKPKAKR